MAYSKSLKENVTPRRIINLTDSRKSRYKQDHATLRLHRSSKSSFVSRHGQTSTIQIEKKRGAGECKETAISRRPYVDPAKRGTKKKTREEKVRVNHRYPALQDYIPRSDVLSQRKL